MREEIRIKINKIEQKRLFTQLKQKFGSRKKIANILRIKEQTYKGYAYSKVRYIPKIILDRTCAILKEPIPHILKQTTLKNIRQKTIKKTYPILRKKYGKDWQKKLAARGHATSQRKYGNEWRKRMTKRGYQTSRK